MRLIELELENFRQFSHAAIPFQSGVTAIIGANGAGKTTLFEAVIWALYGAEAKRGDNPSLRNLWSDSNRVSARLQFELGGELYQVKRSMDNAHISVYRDQDWVSLATGLGPVTKKSEEILGMNLRQFETSFCAQQKELEFMAYEKDKRREEISRMLGYERLSKAIETLKNDLTNLRREIAGLREGLGSSEHLKEQLAQVDSRIQEAEQTEQSRQAALTAARQQVEQAKPVKELAEQKKQTYDLLDTQLKQLAYQHSLLKKQREDARHEWEEIQKAGERLNALRPVVKEYQETRQRLQELDSLAANETKRAALHSEQSLLNQQIDQKRAQIRVLEGKEEDLNALQPQLQEYSSLEARLTQLREEARQSNLRVQLETSAQEQERRLTALQTQIDNSLSLEEEQKGCLEKQAAAQSAIRKLEVDINHLRETWNQQKAICSARLASLLSDEQRLKQRFDQLQALGKEGECPTCGQELGDSFEGAMAELESALKQIKEQRLRLENEQRELEQEPPELPSKLAELSQQQTNLRTLEAEAARFVQKLDERERQIREANEIHQTLESLIIQIGALPLYDPEEERSVSERLNALETVRTKEAELRAEIRQLSALKTELGQLEKRLTQIADEMAALPAGYDAEAHRQARAFVQQHQAVYDEAQQLAGVVQRLDSVKQQAVELNSHLKRIEEEQQAAQKHLIDLNFSLDAYQQALREYDSAVSYENLALHELTQAQGELRGLKMQQETLLKAYVDYQNRAKGLSDKEQEQRFKGALSTALQEFRTELNARLRPQLADYASEFLSQMTGGRYTEIEIDEQYGFWLKDEGMRKSVISGGEGDVVNLSLRLALARLITEKAGVPLSLLMLDEVFGSLDTERRQNVLEVLFNLRDWFQQILVISHLEEINDAVDHSLWVVRDPQSRSSRVSERAIDIGSQAATLLPSLPEDVNEGLFATNNNE